MPKKIFSNTPRLSLRQVFLLAVVVGLLIPALIASVMGFRLQREQLSAQMAREQQRLVEIVSLGMQEPLWNLNRQSGAPLLDSVMEDERIVSVRVTDTLSKSVFLSALRAPAREGRVVVLERPVVYRGDGIGMVHIEFDTRYLADALAKELESLAMVVLAQLGLSIALIMLILNSRFLRPMQQLSQQAEELAALRLQTPFVWQRRDEIGVVGRHLEWARSELARLLGELKGKADALELDIQHRREVEEALRHSEAKYRELFWSNLDGIVICSLDGQIVDANPAFLAMFGYSLEQIRRQSFWTLVSAQSEALELRNLQDKVLQQGFCDEFEASYLSRLGKELPVSVKAVAMREEGGRIAGVWRMVRDISARREAEERLLLAGKVFDHTAEGVLITDAQGVIRSANRALGRITGFSQQEVLGKTPALFASGQQDKAFYQQMWQQLKAQGAWQGEIINRRKNGELYPQWLVINAVHGADGETTHYVAICSDESERRAADERIDYLAHFDALTGLPNRTQMEERSAVVLANAGAETAAALMLLDLDRFKTINESLGHAAGDMLLRVAANRILAILDEGQVLGRQGGDEFIVLLPLVRDPSEILQLAARIQQALAATIEVNGHAVQVSASIGISLFPQDGADFDTLVRNADAAMYHAKAQGRGLFKFYTADLNARARELLELEVQLRQAVEARQFVLHYQPLVDLVSGRIVAAEALIRWQHPSRGLLGPQAFIDVAEDSGHILAIGNWVIDEACRQLAIWRAAGLPAIRIGVNLSASQFRQHGLVDALSDALARHGIAPQLLDVEVTESVIMEDVPATTAAIEAINAMGISLSIDDFGTGYSSLAYLKRFKAGKLKIDRSFICGLPDESDDAVITRTIISMASSLNMRVVAEGVETQAQWDFLAAEGCDMVQGYFYSRPVPAELFAVLLGAPNPPAPLA